MESAAESLKVPPQSVEAEQSVLGGLLLDNQGWDRIADIITADDFYRREHRLIFQAVSALCEESSPADVVTVSEWLERSGEIATAGGLAYLGSLANNTPGAANIVAYAAIVRECSVMRELARAASDISTAIYTPEGRSANELLDLAEKRIFDISEKGHRRGEFHPLNTLLSKAVDRIDELFRSKSSITGVATGFSDLDEMTSGLQGSDLIIIAGRPSMGKCLVHDSELVMDDGSVVTIEEIFRNRRRQRVGTLAKNLRLARATPSDYVDDGVKPVFEVTTRSGRRIETTLTHPFLTLPGWRPLHGLKVGDAIAVPRCLPVFGHERLRECEVKLLAYLIGDGGLTGNTARFTNSNTRIVADFKDAVHAFGGLSLTIAERRSGFAPSWSVVSDRSLIATRRAEFSMHLDRELDAGQLSARAVAAAVGVAPATLTYWRQGKSVPDEHSFSRLCEVLCVQPAELAPNGLSAARKNGVNPLARWLETHDLMRHGASQKSVPPVVFRLEREQQTLFLNRLFATDGWATVLKSGQAQLGYATINERLARQVQHLLLRFGVISSLRQRWVKYREARRPVWQLDITHADSILTFGREIGIHGKEKALAAAVEAVAGRRRQTNTDLIPVEVWDLIARAKGDLPWSELARKAGVSDSNIHVGRRGLSRARLARFAMTLGNRELLALADSDVYWDRIVSIVPAGAKQVYDLTIPETHNFIANDVCVHNTSLAMNIAENASVGHKIPVAVFSMEMPGTQLALRMMASLGRINAHRVRTGKLDDDDWPRLTSAVSLLNEAPIFIDDSPGLTPMELRARARRLKREHGLGLIIIDYLQLMQSTERTEENRATEISNITRALKGLAKELDVPVIAMSQLNRSVESRTDKRPVMSDLRESGAIEQDADVILFIYRDEVYNKDSPVKGTADIIIAKQRNGPIGEVRLTFLGEYTRFENYTTAGYDGSF
ncbi:MAG: replicative DNA helicase [Sulfuricaulis sp.]|uniref:replicative DNA helicase n=1 Tax=Sulfuricaulis sp. TaxID=2003553 RepID=UPI003C5D3A0B